MRARGGLIGELFAEMCIRDRRYPLDWAGGPETDDSLYDD